MPEEPTPIAPNFTPNPPVNPNNPVLQPPQPSFQPMMPQEAPPKPQKRKLILISAITLLVLLAVAGYVFAFYLPQQPGNTYKAGLTNTGKAIDRLVAYTEQQKTVDYKGADFAAAGHVKSADGSYDLSASGSADDSGNAAMAIDANVVGEKFHGEIRSVKAKDNTTPDIYLKASNAQKLLGQFGLEKYNDRWIVIDHTLLDTYVRKAQASANADSVKITTPTPDQISDALTKLQTVNKTYLFTTDQSKAVLQNEQFVGKGKLFHDRTAYHYKVGYNKEHLKAYVTEAKKALDDSKLNDWFKSITDKNISEQSGLDTLEDEVQKAKSDYKFDLWIDAATRVVSQLQFADPKDAASTFTIAQHYTSGDQYPFSFSFKEKDANGKPTSGAFDLTLDTKTHKITAVVTGKSQDANDKAVDISGNLTVTPTNKSVEVKAPTGATSVNDLLQEMLGGLSSASPTLFELPSESSI